MICDDTRRKGSAAHCQKVTYEVEMIRGMRNRVGLDTQGLDIAKNTLSKLFVLVAAVAEVRRKC